MARRTIRHDQLENGMRVWNQGHLFRVKNVKTAPRATSYRDPTPIMVTRYTGIIEDPKDDCYNTGYNGGTYGARGDVLCDIEED